MKNRIIAALLLAAILGTAVGCSNNTQNTADTTNAATTDASVSETTVDEFALRLPEGLNFDKKTVKIYVRGDNLTSEFDAENTGDIVDDAIYNRNLAIEDRLNVSLEYFANTGDDPWTERNIYMDTVRTSVMSNDNAMDIVAGLSLVMPTLAGEGLFLNLLGDGMEYLDFTRPWWNESLIDELAMGDKLYSATGDASLGLIKGVICMYFNQSIIDDYQLDDPYELVQTGKWTLDKFQEMGSAVYSDLNGSGTSDNEDRFGFEGLNENHLLNFYFASGLRMTEKDKDGNISLAMGGEKVVDALTRITDILSGDSFIVKQNKKSVTETEECKLFINGQVLFQVGQFSTAEMFRDTKFAYGIIPYPKYDEEQDGYYTHARNTMTGFSIPITSDAEMCSAVLEAMAWESWKNVTPTYYEKAMKIKYSMDDTTSQMLDLIKDGICYDFGMWHYIVLGSNPPAALIKRIFNRADASTWVSTYETERDVLENLLTEYLNKLDALEY